VLLFILIAFADQEIYLLFGIWEQIVKLPKYFVSSRKLWQSACQAVTLAKSSLYIDTIRKYYYSLHNLASETVILELVISKCMPILLYGLESFHLSNADLRSLDFTFNRLFMKLFKTNSIDVKACQSFTGSEVPSCVLKRKTDKFILRFNCVENIFCNFCSSI